MMTIADKKYSAYPVNLMQISDELLRTLGNKIPSRHYGLQNKILLCNRSVRATSAYVRARAKNGIVITSDSNYSWCRWCGIFRRGKLKILSRKPQILPLLL